MTDEKGLNLIGDRGPKADDVKKVETAAEDWIGEEWHPGPDDFHWRGPMTDTRGMRPTGVRYRLSVGDPEDPEATCLFRFGIRDDLRVRNIFTEMNSDVEEVFSLSYAEESARDHTSEMFENLRDRRWEDQVAVAVTDITSDILEIFSRTPLTKTDLRLDEASFDLTLNVNGSVNRAEVFFPLLEPVGVQVSYANPRGFNRVAFVPVLQGRYSHDRPFDAARVSRADDDWREKMGSKLSAEDRFLGRFLADLQKRKGRKMRGLMRVGDDTPDAYRAVCPACHGSGAVKVDRGMSDEGLASVLERSHDDEMVLEAARRLKGD